jgi:anti-anti-sigma factor
MKGVMMEFLTIDTVHDGIIFDFHQDIDAGITNQLARQIERDLPDYYRFLVIELSEVTFLDSAAVNLLINLIKTARAGDIPHGIAGADLQPLSVLKMIGVDTITNFYPHRRAAIMSLSSNINK